MKPDISFRTLFQRSRYARETGILGDGPGSDRKEIFAVAMVAFAFKHDRVFAAHFLKEICGVPRSGDPRNYSVEFQPEHHADLAIYSDKLQELYVIEFKIGADLQPKQNPWDKSFFKKNGYGLKIRSDPRWNNIRRRTYIVLQNSRISDRDVLKRGLHCLSRRWKDIVPRIPVKGIYADLLDSLAGFGIPSLKVWKGNRMNIGGGTKTAVEMHQLLRGIADDFKLPRRRHWNIDKDPEDWWFGLDWSKQSPEYKTLARTVKSKWQAIGWFGYQQNRNAKPRRAIWLYCGSKKQQQVTEKWLNKRLPKQLMKLIHHDDESLYIATPANTAGRDHAWFTETLNVLKDR